MKDISIIVPFYNSEKYLERCVKSICEQTISNQLELIFVNDCSTDSSVDVIKKTLNECAFMGDVTFINHDTNKGAAIARKTGIGAAKGKYILFCDSDDWQNLDMCEKLLYIADKEKCDMVVCNYNSVRGDVTTSVMTCYMDDLIRGILLCSCNCSLWNKLINRTLFEDPSFIFPQKTYCEDLAYCIQTTILSKKIGHVNEPLYNYLHREGSIVSTTDPEYLKVKFKENIDNFQIVLTSISNHNLLDKYKSEIISLKLTIKNSIRKYTTDKIFLNLWHNTFPELNWEIFYSKDVSLRSILAYYLTLMGIYPHIKKIINILGIAVYKKEF